MVTPTSRLGHHEQEHGMIRKLTFATGFAAGCGALGREWSATRRCPCPTS